MINPLGALYDASYGRLPQSASNRLAIWLQMYCDWLAIIADRGYVMEMIELAGWKVHHYASSGVIIVAVALQSACNRLIEL